MHYSRLLSTILASIAIVKAQTPGFNPFITPSQGQVIHVGQNFDILWQHIGAPDDATVTIKLLQGETPSTMQLGPVVASKIPSKAGRYTWAVPRSTQDAKTYGFAMYLDGKEDVFQYSFPFDIDGQNNTPTPAPAPVANPDAGKAPSPNPQTPVKGGDDDEDDEDDDSDAEDDDGDDDDDDDDTPSHVAPTATAIPYPDPKYSNGTFHYPRPTGVAQPSAVYPIPAQPSYIPTDKTKPITISGAQSLAFNSFAVVGGLAVAMVL